MNSGEALTRLAVWLALIFYVAGELARFFRRDRPFAGWMLNAVGCGFFLAHVAFAFQFFYHWSHAVAYADTARQTSELTGWNSGAGLFVNYFFGLVWLSDVIWTRVLLARRALLPRWVNWFVRFFFLFMIFNGAFVFVRGPVRWFGLFLCVILAGVWSLGAKRRIDSAAVSKSS